MNARKTKTSCFLLCIMLACLVACGGHEDADVRTKEQQAQLQCIADSLLRLNPKAMELCDSIIRTATDSLTYYDYYILKGRYCLISLHPDSALIFARKTRSFANRANKTPRILGLSALANNTEASFYHFLKLDRMHDVIPLYTLAYKQIMSSDLKNYSPEISANLADAYFAVDDLPNAAKWYRRALFLVDSLNLPQVKNVTLYMGLGEIYTTLRDYKTAKCYYEMTERQFDKMLPNMQSYFLNNYGNYYYYKGDYKRALVMFTRLKDHLGKSGAEKKFDMYLCKINLADVYLNLNATDSAELYVTYAGDYFAKNNVEVGKYYANTIRIGIALKRQDYKRINHILKEEHLTDVPPQTLQNIRSKYLREYYVQTGDWHNAYENLRRNHLQNDSMEYNRMHMRASEIMMRFTEDTLKLHHQLAIEEKNAVVSRSKNTIWVLACVVLAIASISVCGGFYMRKRRLQTHMEIIMLKLNNARQRISPHFVFNVLNAKICSATAEEKDILLKLAKLIRTNLEMTSRESTTLFEELSFITEYVKLERIIIGDDFEFRTNLPDAETLANVRIPAMFIQILVENAIKHGLKNTTGYKLLCIDIKCTEEATVIDVTDNGPGFDIRRSNPNSTKTGLSVISHTISAINQKNHNANAMRFCISNIETANEGIKGCKASLHISKKIKFI